MKRAARRKAPEVFTPRAVAVLAAMAVIAASYACGSSSTTLLQPSNDRCSIAMPASPPPISASGGTGSINVNAARECVWSVTSDVAWLTITSGSSGQGDGTVSYAVANNPAPVIRRGFLTVNSQRTEIVQSAAPCEFRLNPSGQSFEPPGGEGTVSIDTIEGCSWTATSGAPWIAIVSTQQINGPGTLRFRVEPNTGDSRASTMTIAGQPFAVAQAGPSTPPQCRFSIDPSSFTAPVEGGTSSVAVAGGAGCAWTATSQASWITVTSGANGSGNGTVGVRFAPNTGPLRSGTVAIANLIYTVTQPAPLVCSYTLTPPAFSTGSAASTTSFTVTAPNGCAWNAASQASWIAITGGASGSGNGTVSLSIAANSGSARNGTVTVNGQTFTVNQVAIPCAYSIASNSFSAPAAGGSTSVAVTAPSGCAWTASTADQWITIPSGSSGSGDGTVNLTIAANGGAARTGTATIAGQAFTVTQAAAPAPCTYSIAPLDQSFPFGGGTSTVVVTTQAGCAWTAVSQAPSWIVVDRGATGTGSGNVDLTVARNTGPARSGTVAIAGQTFTVNQAAEPTPCTYTIAPQSLSLLSTGGPVTVAVTTQPNCAWTADSQATWIIVDKGATGRGSGNVDLTVARNTGPARTGTVAIAGQSFTVNQAAEPPPCTYAFDPTSQMATSAGGDFTVAVNTQPGCAWTVTITVPWIAFIEGSPSSGVGSGTVRYHVSPNTASMQRVGTLETSGQVHTVTQAWPF